MSINQAAKIVLSAAEANANGSFKSAEILEAAMLLRAYLKDQDEPQQDLIPKE